MKRFLSIFLAIFCLISFSGCQREEKPDIPDDVTDVRVTVKPYEDKYTKKYNQNTESKIQYLRAYYGFYSNGEWYDYPIESYDLISIFGTDFQFEPDMETIDSMRGVHTGLRPHMVKIGPYLLVSIRTTGECTAAGLVRTDNKTKEIISISDTIDSKVEKHFSEYYSPSTKNGNEGEYGTFIKQFDTKSYDSKFGEWYTVLLECDKIPKDYVLTVVSKNVYDEIVEETLTYDDIQEMLAWAENKPLGEAIKESEAKEHIDEFFNAIVDEDYQKVETLCHPKYTVDLEKSFQILEEMYGIDFQKGVTIEYTDFNTSLYNSKVHDPSCVMTMKTIVDGKTLEFTVEIVKQKTGLGICRMEAEESV